MAKGFSEDDFLVPSLDRRHNVKRVKRGWDPAMVVWASVFVGPFGASFLIWMNGVQLGVRNLKWCVPALIFMLIIGLLFSGSVTSLLSDSIPERAIPIAAVATWVGTTYWATRDQKVRFRIFEIEGGKSSHWFGFGVGAYFLNKLLSKGLIAVLSAAFGGGL